MKGLHEELKNYQEVGFIEGPAGKLEVRSYLAKSISNKVAVICHPHPLHGGTMDNKVVTALVRGFRELGIHCVCFNFRSVGLSQGEFDEGRGELDDLLAIVKRLKSLDSLEELYLAGFSFGSAIAAQASYLVEPSHLTLVAPPLERYRFDQDGRFPCPSIVIQGGSDERVNSLQVSHWHDNLASASLLIRLPEACHFFHGHLGPFKREWISAFKQQIPS